MKALRIGLLLLILLALAVWAGLLPPLPAAWRPSAIAWPDAPAPQLYRWQDPQGRVTYGSRPPAGVKAEAVADKGTLSVVPATKPPAAKTAPRQLPPGVTIQQLATERAIEQATGDK